MTGGGHPAVTGSTAEDELPEPHEDRLTNQGETTEAAKRKVALALDRRRDPYASKQDLADDLSDINPRQVTRALKGLQQDRIVARREGNSGEPDLWYMNHKHSEYGVPPDITVAEAEGFNLREALLFQNPHVPQKITLLLMIWSIAFLAIGGLAQEIGVIGSAAGSDIANLARIMLIVSISVFIAGLLAEVVSNVVDSYIG